jgi:Leucine-rich repeat (LRR) protein
VFRTKNLKELHLSDNKLCSLPSEIARLATLKVLYV